jgi:hypothetical protein
MNVMFANQEVCRWSSFLHYRSFSSVDLGETNVKHGIAQSAYFPKLLQNK